METMTVRQSWSDDEGFRHVEVRFEQVDKRFEQVDRHFDKVDERFDRVEGELLALRSEMNLRFDGMQRTLLILGGGMFAALAGAFATQLALILTQI